MFKFSLILINNYLKILKSLYNKLNSKLGVVKMPDTIRLVLFILIAISAVFSLIKEFKKSEKKALWITIEFLVLFWAIWVIANIII